MKHIVRFAAIISLLTTAALRADQDWPRFRGPTGQGISNSKNLPLNWSDTQNIVWKTAIHGRAWSSPVVMEKRIWVSTATPDGKELSALCVDLDNGKILLDEKLFDIATPQYAHPFNTYGSPTPVLEPGRVYVTFGSPGTACLDSATGKVLWQRTDFVCNHYRGSGSSPLLFGDLLIMNFDGSDFQFIVGLDKKTGKTVWKTDRSIDWKDTQPDGKPMANGDFHKGFSTPVIAEQDGRPIVVSLGSKALYAYEPTTGKEIWRIEDRETHSGSDTPVIGNGLIIYGTGMGNPELWALRPGGSGLLSDASVAWKYKKQVPGKPSVLLVDDLIYMINDGGIASCIEAKTGEPVWHHRIDGAFSASPLYANGRIYLCSENGTTTVIAAGREFKVLAENTLPDGLMASPAVAENALILRTRTNLYRIEDSGTPAK